MSPAPQPRSKNICIERLVNTCRTCVWHSTGLSMGFTPTMRAIASGASISPTASSRTCAPRRSRRFL
eukprot:6205960-Pleurochrysis_carterae.AAC.2